MLSGYQCAGCGEWNEITIDASQGRRQTYVEDCQVCCKPNLLNLYYDEQEHEYVVTADLESA
jgi:hypothetical protein